VSGRLFVVATPLGNLEDVTLRALAVLREVDLIACEDTRRTARLLQAHGIRTPTTSYFDHNERLKAERLLERLREGRDVALVSDAGTPTLSDPGYHLVRAARAEGLPVLPIPGPSALATALSVSGLPTDRFLFVGFLPSRAGARRRAVEELRGRSETLVLYESPRRLLSLLGDLVELLGDREAFLCREATKLHEEYLGAPLSALAAELRERDAIRGEVTLVVAGASDTPDAPGARDPEDLFEELVAAGATRREAVKQVARRLGLPAREVYRRTLGASGEEGSEESSG
jgi:16S rRNA (cytidine1402-2'-O)-methyltransferase